MRIPLLWLICVTFSVGSAWAEESIEGAVGYLAFLGGERCTGTLIGPKIVLTASHCLKGVVGDQVRFTLDPDPDNGANASFAGSELVRMHPDFRYGFQNGLSEHDIALVKLADTNYGPPPLKFPKLYGGDELPAGTTARAVGYGYDKDGKVGRRRMRQVRLIGWGKGTDGKKADTVLRMTRGDLGQLPCAGDSGGPVFKYLDGRNQIVAVHSAGSVQTKLVRKAQDSSPDKKNQFFCRETEFSDATSLAAERAWVTRTFLELEGGKRVIASASAASCEGVSEGAACSTVGRSVECGGTRWSCCASGSCFCGCADEEALLPTATPLRAFHRLLGGDLWWARGVKASEASCAAENGGACEGVARADAKVRHDAKNGKCSVEVKAGAIARQGKLVYCAFDRAERSAAWTTGSCGSN